MPDLFHIKGDEAMRDRVEAIAKAFRDQLGAGLRLEAEMIMTRSKRDFVPVDLGALMNSGHVEQPVWDGDTVSVVMAYGGPSAPYALAVHEHPSQSSPPSWLKAGVVNFNPQGHGPKYLERPFMDAVGDGQMIARIVGSINGGLR